VKTMYGRQFAAMAGMVLLSFLMLGASFAALSYQYTVGEQREALEQNARRIAEFTSSYVIINGSASWQRLEFQRYLSAVAQVADSHIMVATNDGVVVYATSGQSQLAELEGGTIPQAMVDTITEGYYADVTSLGGMYDRARYLVGLPVANSSGFLQGLVLVSRDASNISGMWHDLSFIFLVTAIAVILIAAIISSVTSMCQSKPIKEIAAAARQFGLGRLDVRVDVGERKDEVGELADAFNTMADSLSKSEQRRSEFVANVSHELKTPISSLSLAGQMLGDASVRKSDTMMRHIAEVINDDTKRLRFMVEKVLQMSLYYNQKSVLNLVALDANKVIAAAAHSVKLRVEKVGGRIELDLAAGRSLVKVDEMHFANLITNLLDNAVKYRSEEHPLILKIATEDLPHNKLQITVTDTGIGIRKDDLRKIFDKFFRVSTGDRHDVKGFGLGLAYVKKMVEEFGGEITAESEFGRGTTFTLTLPLAPDQE